LCSYPVTRIDIGRSAKFADQAGIRRYSIQRLSYEYIASGSSDLFGAKARDGRVVICHFGSGARVRAIQQRDNAATGAGFSALDSLSMTCHGGDLDAGVVL
jgi:acetate kinase